MTDKIPTEFVTQTGRMVWGSLRKAKTTDYDNNPLVVKSGDRKGQPTQVYQFGVAFAKRVGETHFSQNEFGALAWAKGHADHPGSASRPDFSWKITDGDSTIPGKSRNGQPGVAPCTKKGFPGHWVVTFSSSRAPRVVNSDGSKDIVEVDAVLPGDFVQVSGTILGNTGATPGIYINYDCVAFQGYSSEGRIASEGPDPKTLGFGQGPQPAMVAAPPGGLPATGAAVSPPPPPPAVRPPAPPAPPQTAVAPHPGILVPPLPVTPPPPPPAAVAPPPPPAPGRQMTAIATTTYDQYRASGWTDDQLRAGGLMI